MKAALSLEYARVMFYEKAPPEAEIGYIACDQLRSGMFSPVPPASAC